MIYMITTNFNIDSKNHYGHLFKDIIIAVISANNKAKFNLRKSKYRMLITKKLMQ